MSLKNTKVLPLRQFVFIKPIQPPKPPVLVDNEVFTLEKLLLASDWTENDVENIVNMKPGDFLFFTDDDDEGVMRVGNQVPRPNTQEPS